MSAPDPSVLPPNLPVPDDDGAADHLPGFRVPPIHLLATNGREVVLGESPGRTLIFCYPHLGHPDAGLPTPDWDLIPGARGCTSQACGFRAGHAELADLGLQVFGVSTDEPGYQQECAERLSLPFPLLSDVRLELAEAWRLPVFEAAGRIFLKRLTLLLRDGVVERMWYPVFPPDRHAREVIDTLRR